MPARIELARETIITALVACRGRRGGAAELLGVSVATLRRRCDEDYSIVETAKSRMDPSLARAAYLRRRLNRTFYGGLLKEEAYTVFYADDGPLPLDAKRVERLLRRFKTEGRRLITFPLTELYATLNPPFVVSGG